MNDQPKASIGLVIVVIVGIGLVGLLMLGTKVSTVRSKGGASVTGGYPDTTVGGALPEQPASTAAPPTAAPGSAAAAAARAPALLIVRTGTLTLETAHVADAVSAASGVVVESPDHIVWEWRSTRTNPSASGSARWGWRATAAERGVTTSHGIGWGCGPATAAPAPPGGLTPRPGPPRR